MAYTNKLYTSLGLQVTNSGSITIDPKGSQFPAWGSSNSKGPYKGHSSIKTKSVEKKTRKV